LRTALIAEFMHEGGTAAPRSSTENIEKKFSAMIELLQEQSKLCRQLQRAVRTLVWMPSYRPHRIPRLD